MNLTIIPHEDFYFFKRMDDKPAFIVNSQRLMRDSISHQIAAFAQEIVNHGFAANRSQVKTHIRGELYHRIKNLIVKYLAKHPHQNMDEAFIANAEAVRKLISDRLPQYRPYLHDSGVADSPFSAAAAPIPAAAFSTVDESGSESAAEVDNAEINRVMLEKQLSALVEERTELRSKLNSLKFEENKLAHLMANLLDQPQQIDEQNHKKRKAPIGQLEHKPAKSELLSHEDQIMHLEKAIARTEQGIEKLQQEIKEKRHTNQLEHRKIAIIVERRDRAEQARLPAISITEETESFSTRDPDPVPQKVKRPVQQVSPEVLKLVPRSVLIARKNSRP